MLELGVGVPSVAPGFSGGDLLRTDVFLQDLFSSLHRHDGQLVAPIARVATIFLLLHDPSCSILRLLLVLEVVIEELKSFSKVEFRARVELTPTLLLFALTHLVQIHRVHSRLLGLRLATGAEAILLGVFERLLKTEHLVADIVANLDGDLVLKFEFFAAAVLEDGLALFVRALVLAAPLLVLVNQRK